MDPRKAIAVRQFPVYTPAPNAPVSTQLRVIRNMYDKILKLEAYGFKRLPVNTLHEAASLLTNPRTFIKAGWSNSYCNVQRVDTYVIKHLNSIIVLLDNNVTKDLPAKVEYSITYRSTYTAFMYHSLYALVIALHLKVTYIGKDNKNNIFFTIEM